jgi:hypothetical protein
MPRIKAQLSAEPAVGIIYLVKGNLWIDGTPVSKAGDYGEFKIHENDHIRYWDQLMRTGSVPKLSEYEEHPRGRVVYNTKTRQYTLYLDRCILGKKAVVQRIIREMRLPGKQTATATDSHYRCFRCLAQMHSETES